MSVGDLVDRRFGTEVTDRLVEPLLGGVYAGQARRISARAAVPQAARPRAARLLLERAAALPPSYGGPVFAGLPGGWAASRRRWRREGLDVRTGATVRALERTPTGFRLVVGPTTAPEIVVAETVVLATPAAPSARLLGDVAPVAARELAGIESASMVVVTFAFRAGDAAVLDGLGASGSWCRPSRAGGSRQRRSRSRSGTGSGPPDGALDGDDLLLCRTSLERHG